MTASNTSRALLVVLVAAGAGPAFAQPDARAAALRECVVRGDHPCIVRILRGNPRDAREMSILIEAYGRTGQTAQAEHQMRVFVQRYPNHSRTPGYLARLGTEPASEAGPVDVDAVVRECVQRGDQPCLIRALRGRAVNPRYMTLLIEAYLRVGDTNAAVQQMRIFVQRYPNHSRAARYLQLLEVELTPPPRR